MRDFQEMAGQRYGSLFVIEVYPREKDAWGHLKPAKAMCQCECGNFKVAKCYDLIEGRLKSCGCQKGNVTGKRHSYYRRSMRCYSCKNPDEACIYSSVLRVCCWECPKREQCSMVCSNKPEKCGAKKYLASEEVRDFLTRKGDYTNDSEIFKHKEK